MTGVIKKKGGEIFGHSEWYVQKRELYKKRASCENWNFVATSQITPRGS